MRRVLIAMALIVVTASPACAKLEVEKIEVCYSRFGPVRKTLEFYPYDEVWITFIVKNAKSDADGRCDVEFSHKVVDDKGKEVLARKGASKGLIAFGSESFPAGVSFVLPEPVIAGEYTVQVTIKDNLSGDSTNFEKKLKLKAAEFAIVSPQFFRDAGYSIPAPPGGCVGEFLNFRVWTIGFDRSQGKLDNEITVQVLDKDKKELLPKPLKYVAEKADPKIVKDLPALDFGGSFMLTRAGEFTLRVSVTDRNSKKTATWEAPLKVTEP